MKNFRTSKTWREEKISENQNGMRFLYSRLDVRKKWRMTSKF